MADRFTVNRRFQIAPESTHGVPVTATKLLEAMRFTAFGPKNDMQTFTASGHRFPDTEVQNAEWSEGQADIDLTYGELVYVLSGLWGDAAITTPGGGTNSRQWLWTPALTGSLNGRTYTIEDGDIVRGAQVAGLQFNDLELDFARKGGVSGKSNALGLLYTDNFTMTTSLSGVGKVPIMGKHLAVYMDNTSGNIGVTALTRPFKSRFMYGPGYSPIWTMDRSQTSYAATAEAMAPKAQFELTLGADAIGMGLLADLRSGVQKYIRMEAVGATIESTIKYTLQIDMSCQIGDFTPPTDLDNVVSVTVPFDIMTDDAWSKAFSVKLINTLTAL